MKKRLSLIIEPVENGYVVQATSSEENGGNAKSTRFIAKDDQEAFDNAIDWMNRVFKNMPEQPVG